MTEQRRTFLALFMVASLLVQAGCSMFGEEAPAATEQAETAPEAAAPDAEMSGAADAAQEASTALQPAPEQPAADEIAAAARPEAPSPGAITSVELLWQVPTEAVQKYHLRYGFEESQLDRHIEIPIQKLQKIDEPGHGLLFRYVIPSVPANSTVFFTIQAENQYGLSPASPVQSVAPN